MVLGGNFDFAGSKIFDWLISTPMAEFQLKSFPAERQSEELMSKTNTENRPVVQ